MVGVPLITFYEKKMLANKIAYFFIMSLVKLGVFTVVVHPVMFYYSIMFF